MKENDLFIGLKEGDRIAIKTIYKDFFPKVKQWVLNNNGSSQDAADIFQEVLETILLKIETVNSSFEALVIQMTKYKWIDKIRKKKTARNHQVNVEKSDSMSSENQIITSEQEYIKYKLLDKHFTQLSELCQALILKLKEGLSASEIVNALNFKSANTLYRRKAACIERWSTLIKADKNYTLLNE